VHNWIRPTLITTRASFSRLESNDYKCGSRHGEPHSTAGWKRRTINPARPSTSCHPSLAFSLSSDSSSSTGNGIAGTDLTPQFTFRIRERTTSLWRTPVLCSLHRPQGVPSCPRRSPRREKRTKRKNGGAICRLFDEPRCVTPSPRNDFFSRPLIQTLLLLPHV